MQTRTKPNTTSRIGRRPAPAPQGRFKRHVPKQPSTQEKAMSALTGMLGKQQQAGKGGRASGASAGKGGRAGKMAMLAGGLGLAMKNRDKLMGLLNRRTANKTAAASAQPAPPPAPPTPPPASASL